MEFYAELIAAHVVLALLLLSASLLAMIAICWRVLQRCGPRLWRSAAVVLRGLAGQPVLRSLARRLRALPYVSGAVARLSATMAYLGLEALLSFAVAIGASGAFFELADEIGLNEDLARFDESLARALHMQVARPTLEVFATLTRLGDRNVLLALGIAVALVLLWRRRWMLAAAWALATSLGGVLNYVLKALFERTRPMHDETLVQVQGYSFPSGHASGAVLVYGLLAYLIVRSAPRPWHLPTALVAAVLIVFVGFSRVILQVHWLSDVLAGYASAAAWVTVWIAGLEAASRRGGRPASSVLERACFQP